MADKTLVQAYTGLVVDLDGVVYRGPDAIDGAVDALNTAADADLPVMYATNNAGRPAVTVAEHLKDLGIRTDADHVVTSAQAGAGLLAQRLEQGATVLAVGGPGVGIALREVGLRPVTPQQRIEDPDVADQIEAVLQGYGQELTWSDLKEAAYAVTAGAYWMATNVDLTIPTDRGIAPGNGSAVGAVRNVVGHDPDVAGKPYPPLYERCAERVELDVATMLAVGDRLDTDIEGANASGMESLHVLTGVDGPAELAQAPDTLRPTFVALDLRALHEPYGGAQLDDGDTPTSARCGDAVARLEGSGDETALRAEGGEPVQQVRAAVRLVWAAIDDGRLERTSLPEGVLSTLREIDPR